MHFVNNGSIVLIASVPDHRAWFETAGDGPPWILLPPAVLAIVLGFHLMPPLRVGREKSGTQSRCLQESGQQQGLALTAGLISSVLSCYPPTTQIR